MPSLSRLIFSLKELSFYPARGLDCKYYTWMLAQVTACTSVSDVLLNGTTYLYWAQNISFLNCLHFCRKDVF